MGQGTSLLNNVSEEQIAAFLKETQFDRQTLYSLAEVFSSPATQTKGTGATPKTPVNGLRGLAVRRKASSVVPVEQVELNREQFIKLLEEGNICHGEPAARMFEVFDTDGSGSISLKEFLASMSVLLKGEPEQKLQYIFRAYDLDNSNTLTTNEVSLLADQMLSVFKSKGFSAAGIEAEQTVRGFLRSLDANGDGVITLEEFVSEGLKNPRLLPLLVAPVWDLGEDAKQRKILQLIDASRSGRVEKVKSLLREGVDANGTGEMGETALLAAARKHGKVVRVLLEEGHANPNLANFGGYSPLHRAAGSGDPECIEELLMYKAAVDATNLDGWTPFHVAASFGDVAAAKLLLKHGAHPEALTKTGLNALHIAASADRPEMISFLVTSHKINNVNAPALGEMSFTPLHFAASECNLDAIRILIELNATIDARDEAGFTPLFLLCRRSEPHPQIEDCARLLLSRQANPLLENKAGNTPLHVAALSNNSVMCHFLAQLKKELMTVKNADGKTPVQVAQKDAQSVLQKDHISDLPDLTRKLLDAVKQNDVAKVRELTTKGADANANDGAGNSALYFAILNKNPEAAAILLQSGARVDVQNERGSPLHAAIMTGVVPLVASLLEHKADITQPDPQWGMQAIHTAAFFNKPDIIRLLVARGAKVEEKSAGGKTPLHWAAQRGQKEAMETLLSLGANKEALTDDGLTPLHLAAANGRALRISVLLAAGANAHAVTPEGKTVLHFAVQDGDCNSIAALMKAAPESITARTVGGDTVLHRLCEGGSHDAVLLFATNAQELVHAKNQFGQTPLHLAARHASCQFITNLLSLHPSVDINAEDAEGRTPIYYAAAARKEDTIQLLRSRGAFFKEEKANSKEIQFEESNTYPKVGSATTDALIKYLILTCDKIDDIAFRDAFFLSYRQFMKPNELLQQLFDLYGWNPNSGSNDNNNNNGPPGDVVDDKIFIPNLRASSAIPKSVVEKSDVDVFARKRVKSVRLKESYRKQASSGDDGGSTQSLEMSASDISMGSPGGNLDSSSGDVLGDSSRKIGESLGSSSGDVLGGSARKISLSTSSSSNAKFLIIPENLCRRVLVLRTIRRWVMHSLMDFDSSVALRQRKRILTAASTSQRTLQRDFSGKKLLNLSSQAAPMLRGNLPDENMTLLERFLGSLANETDEEIAAELKLLRKALVEDSPDAKIVGHKPNFRASMRPTKEPSKAASLLDWTPQIVAQQLTIMSKRYWDSLSLWEFYDVAFTKKDKDQLCPNINAFIRHVNQVGDWVKTLVLEHDDAKKRGAVLTFFIQLVDACLALRNFSDAFALGAALQATTLERLAKTWKLVSEDLTAQWAKLKAVLDPRGNYSVFRKKLEEDQNAPTVPFIAILMGDVLHADEVTKTVDGRHNWHKYELLGRLLNVIPKYARLTYPFVEDKAFATFFHGMELLDGDQARVRSKEVEPPAN